MCVLLVMFKRITYLAGQKLTPQKVHPYTKPVAVRLLHRLIPKQIRCPDDCWELNFEQLIESLLPASTTMVIKTNNSRIDELDVLENKVAVKFMANPRMENWNVSFPNGWAVLPGFISTSAARWLLSPRPITPSGWSRIPRWQAPSQQDPMCFHLNTQIVPLVPVASQWNNSDAPSNSTRDQGHEQGVKGTKKSWIARQVPWKSPCCYPKRESFV